eukprot:5688757-Pyramimonas_sp.AAC.1
MGLLLSDAEHHSSKLRGIRDACHGQCDCQMTPVQDLPDRDPGALQPEDLQRQHRGAGHVQQSGRGQGQAPGTEVLMVSRAAAAQGV